MFSNGTPDGEPCSEAFWNFLNKMGREIDLNGWTNYTGDMKTKGETISKTYYDKWNEIEIIYHVAPLLDKEGHRRLIGNDIAVLFFLDEDYLFSPYVVDELGKVPQIFGIVQASGDLYRVSFFTLSNIKEFGPPLPPKLLNSQDMKDFILSKSKFVFQNMKFF